MITSELNKELAPYVEAARNGDMDAFKYIYDNTVSRLPEKQFSLLVELIITTYCAFLQFSLVIQSLDYSTCTFLGQKNRRFSINV